MAINTNGYKGSLFFVPQLREPLHRQRSHPALLERRSKEGRIHFELEGCGHELRPCAGEDCPLCRRLGGLPLGRRHRDRFQHTTGGAWAQVYSVPLCAVCYGA
jgi:hypothetical protein